MKIFFTITLLLTTFLTNAQKEHNIWYFGLGAGVDFNGPTPTALTNGKISAMEGCATICDNSGNLLFYTDGVTVWNKNHQVMPNGNGLSGRYTPTQSAVIVKQPGSNTLFYIFTNSDDQDEVSYSIVNITLDGGLGDIILKNQLIYGPSSEKMIAVNHQDGINFWIIIHHNNSNQYRSYLLTATGLDTSPVISNVGLSFDNLRSAAGYLKANLSGSKIAAAHRSNVELFDFDKSNGELSNPIFFNGFYDEYIYGIEFSPNENLLYVSESINIEQKSYLYQFDISSHDPTEIVNSKTIIHYDENLIGGALQLGPNAKIYYSLFWSNFHYLSVINDPDSPGINCNFNKNEIFLDSKRTMFGLPSFINTILLFIPSIEAENFCFGDSTSFHLESNITPSAIAWNFGDPASGIENTSSGNDTKHKYSGTGNFRVEVTLTLLGRGDTTLYKNIRIDKKPKRLFGQDTLFCSNQPLVLDASSNEIDSYKWQDGSTNARHTINSSGIFWVDLLVGSCIKRDSINVVKLESPTIDLGKDTTLCMGDELLLNARFNNAQYLWHDNSIQETNTAKDPGLYWVKVTAENLCISYDSINIFTVSPPVIDLGNDTTLCQGNQLELNVTYPGATYTWQDNSNLSQYVVSSPGNYSVELNIDGCKRSDDINILFKPNPVVNLGNDTTLCDGDLMILNAYNLDATYLWQDNSTIDFFEVTQTGLYEVEVDLNGCLAQDQIYIYFKPKPEVNLGDDTTLCDNQTLLLDVSLLNATYLWQDNSSNSAFNVNAAGIYDVEVTIDGCTSNDLIVVDYKPNPVIDIGNDETLCDGSVLVLNAFNQDATYLWQDNSTLDFFEVTHTGVYEVEVDLNGCVAQDQISVSYNPYPIIGLGNDTTLCDNQTLLLDVSLPNATYLWQDNSSNSAFNVNAAGIYDVEVTINGCTSNDLIVVDYKPNPVIELGNDETLCDGAVVVLNAFNQDASYLWQDNSTLDFFEVIRTGLYEVEVDLNGCLAHEQINITYNPNPEVNLGNDTTLCDGEVLLLDVTIANATYEWQDNSNNPNFNVNVAGLYDVAVTVGGCATNDQIIVDYKPNPLVNLGNDTALCNGDSLLLNAYNQNATYVWQDNSTLDFFEVTQTGLYEVEVDLNSCLAHEQINITYNPNPEVNLGNDTTLCDGKVLLLDVTIANATYEWQDNSNNPNFNVNVAGLYNVSVTVGGCTTNDQIIADYKSNPLVNLGNDTTLCDGFVFVLNAYNQDASYLWQDNSTFDYFEVNQAGSFTVTVDLNGCMAQDQINVSYNPYPIVDLGNDTTLCDGQNIMLDVTLPDATYEWQDNSNNATFNVNDVGIYEVDVTLDGCTSNDLIVVDYKPNPVIDLGNDTTLCDGSVFVLNAYNQDASYLWQDNSTFDYFEVNEAGSFDVTVDLNGCMAQDQINVSYNPYPIVDLGNDTTLCDGQNIMLDVTLPDATYEWQDNSNNATFNVNDVGIYEVDVTLDGCTSNDLIVVDYKPNPVIDLGNDTTLCDGSVFVLNAYNQDASYVWQDNSTLDFFEVNQAGSFDVTVDLNGCVAQDQINVSYNPYPIVDLGNDTTLCDSQNIMLDVTLPDATYEWQDNSNNPTFNIVTSGIYSVAVSVGGCTTDDQIQVNYEPSPNVDLGEDLSICEGDVFTLNIENTSYTYLWQDNTTQSTYTINENGLYWVEVKLGICSLRDSIYASYKPLPTVELGNDTLLCEGEQLLLKAPNAGASYQWQDASTDSIFTVKNTGLYWVNVTLNNCHLLDSIHVNYQPITPVDLGDDIDLCEGEPLILDSGIEGANYLWQDNSTDAMLSVNKAGLYDVAVTVGSCESYDNISVTYSLKPVVDLGADLIFCEGQTVSIDASTTQAKYTWHDGYNGARYFARETGTYTVEASNKCGISVDSVYYKFNNCNCTIYIPNSFTPNNDGTNDYFKAVPACEIYDFSIKIFDLWGELIFEAYDPNDVWDGTFNNKLCKNGSYNYQIYYQNENMRHKTIYGYLNLLR